MVVKLALEPRAEEQRDLNIYLIRPGEEKRLRHFDHCPSIYGSDAHYDPKYGYILWLEYRPVVRDPQGHIPPSFIQVSRLDPRARPEAKYTQHQDLQQILFYPFFSVEEAIRSVKDYIIPGERGKETTQVKAAKRRLAELDNFYSSRSFKDITPDELKQEEQKTLALFEVIGITDPQNLINQLKVRGFMWLGKASTGQDATGRENYIVTLESMKAALLRMTLRENAIRNPIIGKFQLIGEALEFARDFYRSLFDEVAEELQTMSGIVVFKHPGITSKDYEVNMTLAKVGTLMFKLDQVHLLPYFWRAQEARKALKSVHDTLKEEKRVNASQVKQIVDTRTSLLHELEIRKLYHNGEI